MTRMCENLIACYIGIFFLLLSYNCTVVCLFWYSNPLIIDWFSRGFLFLGCTAKISHEKKESTNFFAWCFISSYNFSYRDLATFLARCRIMQHSKVRQEDFVMSCRIWIECDNIIGGLNIAIIEVGFLECQNFRDWPLESDYSRSILI